MMTSSPNAEPSSVAETREVNESSARVVESIAKEGDRRRDQHTEGGLKAVDTSEPRTQTSA